MKKQNFSHLAVWLLIFIFFSCGTEYPSNENQDIKWVKYGTSFGECLGYCKKSMEVIPSEIKVQKNGWEIDKLLPVVELSANISAEYWTSLINNIDFEKFARLNPVIGCPDCADGGAEWIEIQKGSQSFKVIFEYGNEPIELKPYIGYLRTYLRAFDVEENSKVDFLNRTVVNQPAKIKNFVCSRGCNQYLVEVSLESGTHYYFDEALAGNLKVDKLEITISGVLQNDSTTIFKPAANDVPVPDFKARNIELIEINKN